MKMVRAIVYRKRILHAVKSEFSAGDAVGIASRHLAGTRAVSEITERIRIAQHHVCKLVILVRNDSGHDAGPHA